MKNLLAVCCFVVGFAAVADTKEAAAAAAAPSMDWSKMGSPARKITDEKKTKKEIEEWAKKEDELMAKGDMDAMVARKDFPLFMATDDMKGVASSKSYTKEEYVAMMKPMHDAMPKDAKMAHKPSITVLSDSMAMMNDEYTMTVGKTKMTGRTAGLLVKVDGNWKWKTMFEAGWGEMNQPEAKPVAAAPAAAPVAAPAKTTAAAPAPTAAPSPAAPAKK